MSNQNNNDFDKMLDALSSDDGDEPIDLDTTKAYINNPFQKDTTQLERLIRDQEDYDDNTIRLLKERIIDHCHELAKYDIDLAEDFYFRNKEDFSTDTRTVIRNIINK